MFQRFLANYLRKRGWVVFWLDKESRHCSALCWLQEYENSIALKKDK